MKGIFWALQRRLNCYWELKIDFFSDFFYFNLYPITFCDTHTVNLLPSHLGVSTRFLWWSCGKRNVFSESEVTWQVIGDSEWLHHGVFGVECYQTQTDKKTKSAKFDEDIVRLGLCHSDKTAKSFYLRSDKTLLQPNQPTSSHCVPSGKRQQHQPTSNCTTSQKKKKSVLGPVQRSQQLNPWLKMWRHQKVPIVPVWRHQQLNPGLKMWRRQKVQFVAVWRDYQLNPSSK